MATTRECAICGAHEDEPPWGYYETSNEFWLCRNCTAKLRDLLKKAFCPDCKTYPSGCPGEKYCDYGYRRKEDL